MNDKILKASDIKQRFPDGSIETVWGDFYRKNKQGLLELAKVDLPELSIIGHKPNATLKPWTKEDLMRSDALKKEKQAKDYVLEQKEAKDLTNKMVLTGLSFIPVVKGAKWTYKLTSPLVKKVFTNPYIQTGLTIDGARNLFTDNGVLKTYRHFRDGEYGKGALSLTGDVLDAAGAYGLAGTKFIPFTKNYSDNVLRRGSEIFMRSNVDLAHNANPIPQVSKNLKFLLKNKQGGYKRLFSIGNFIFTGKKSGIPGYSNSVALYYPESKKINYYTGFLLRNPRGLEYGSIPYLGKGNDIIDALLYNKTIDPSYGWKLSKSKDLGPHKKYAEEHGDKYINAPIYEEINSDYIDLPLITNNWKSSTNFNVANNFLLNVFSKHLNTYPDVGGHLVLFGESPITNSLFARGQDLWKFNYYDYSNRYKGIYNIAPGIKKSLKSRLITKLGLKTIDKLTLPIIFRTPWIYVKDLKDNNKLKPVELEDFQNM